MAYEYKDECNNYNYALHQPLMPMQSSQDCMKR